MTTLYIPVVASVHCHNPEEIIAYGIDGTHHYPHMLRITRADLERGNVEVFRGFVGTWVGQIFIPTQARYPTPYEAAQALLSTIPIHQVR
jgi:hypothetical protein